MRHARSERVAVYAKAVRGLLELEPDPEQQLKYLDFVDIYAHLSEEERMIYQQTAVATARFAQRASAELDRCASQSSSVIQSGTTENEI